MPTVFNGNGTLVSPTTGANTIISITSISTATPQVVTGGTHGFNTGDTVEVQGNSGLANGLWQITVLSPTTYALNGSPGGFGTGGTGGYAIDYELQPAYQGPADGELADAGTLLPIVEGLSNLAPFLYRAAGQYRTYGYYTNVNAALLITFNTNTAGVVQLAPGGGGILIPTQTISATDILDIHVDSTVGLTGSGVENCLWGIGISFDGGSTYSLIGRASLWASANAIDQQWPAHLHCLLLGSSLPGGDLNVPWQLGIMVSTGGVNFSVTTFGNASPPAPLGYTVSVTHLRQN